jgi:hypothetical protein
VGLWLYHNEQNVLHYFLAMGLDSLGLATQVIRYDPTKLLKKIAPAKKIKKLLTADVSLKKTALSFVNDIDFLNKKDITRVALKTIKGYQKRIKMDPDVEAEIASDPAQLIQRVQNEVVTQVAGEIRDKYEGEFYEWLPSDADEPDPEHQLNYGKTFQVGVGEMPGDRFGCRCGMNILVDETKLEL